MENRIDFRKAAWSDLDGIVRIYDKSHDAEEAGLTTTGWKRGIYPVRGVAEAALERGDMYVAVADGSIAATGVINQIQVDVYADCDWVYKGPDDDVSVLHTLAVDPDARGKGIGPAFVRYWEDLARSEGCSLLRIDTNARNTRARAMYARMGYIETGIIPTVFNGLKDVDLVLMEKFNGTEIQKRLREMQDAKYADFQAPLIPGLDRKRTIGVRTPQLRAFAKELAKDMLKVRENGTSEPAATDPASASAESVAEFLTDLPHKYFDEMQLHAFIISEIKDFGECMREVERFLPYVDNWATCDQLSPKVFAKKKDGRLVYRDELLEHIDGWLTSDRTYTIRYGIGRLMAHFLDEEFDPAWMERVASIRSDEYYINMMIAWYFATALAKQPGPAMAVLEAGKLDRWTHNKTIQKAVESRRITDEMKTYLRGIRR